MSETPREFEFDVDAWRSAESDSYPILHPKGCCSWSDRFQIRIHQPNNQQIISTALLWITIAIIGLNIICLIIFYVDRCV